MTASMAFRCRASSGRRRAGRVAAGLVLFVSLSGAVPAWGPERAGVAWAGWAVGTGTRTGQARSGSLPATPTGVSAVCGLVSDTITVSWSAVSRATSYTILEFNSPQPSSPVATGSASGTTWTSGSLASGTYYFEVEALIGTYWVSAASAASASHTIGLSLLCV